MKPKLKTIGEITKDQTHPFMVDVLRNASTHSGEKLVCIRCKVKYARGGWDFYSLCNKCFRKFDYQKMMARFGLAKGTESATEWVKQCPVGTPDLAVIIVDLEKFPTFTKVFSTCGRFCIRPTEDQIKELKAIFGDTDDED